MKGKHNYKFYIVEEEGDLWFLIYTDLRIRVVTVGAGGEGTHLSKRFNGMGEASFLHLRRNCLQVHEAMQDAKDGLVLSLCLQKSKF